MLCNLLVAVVLNQTRPSSRPSRNPNALPQDVTMELLQRARDAGNCPPSLMQESNLLKEDAFESLLLGTLTETGTFSEHESSGSQIWHPSILGLVLKPDAPSSSQFSELVQVSWCGGKKAEKKAARDKILRRRSWRKILYDPLGALRVVAHIIKSDCVGSYSTMNHT